MDMADVIHVCHLRVPFSMVQAEVLIRTISGDHDHTDLIARLEDGR